ncbi:AAA family ATPase [Streptomyces sp. NRRL F-5053]|uniref:AAA family ATPase n=1 Tax=Streptomyces sp. NRRL F-5053 TaxID=1463854 RepID=UPI00068929F0|nr:AAA family ATPase [Streptomyces sp. NRRL F-5053]
MPAPVIVASGGQFRFYDDTVQIYDQLPVATYTIDFSPTSGYSLRQVAPLAPVAETVYGSHTDRVKRIVRGYDAMDRSVGVILSGDKGMGKSLMIRMLAEAARSQLNLPTVLVQHATPGLASFLDELGEAIVVFDEFEKVFSADEDSNAADEDSNAQNQFLSLFDGMSATKRLYVVSVNELHRVSAYMLNRPGRFHYHMSFEYPETEAVAQYVRDQVQDVTEDQIEEVVDFSRKFDINFDHLRAIAFELSLGEPFADFIGDLNIKRTGDRGSDYVTGSITWANGDAQVISGFIDLFESDTLQVLDDDSGTEVHFRMRDAKPSKTGFVLPTGTFELTANPEADEENGSNNRRRKADSVIFSRDQQPSIDF